MVKKEYIFSLKKLDIIKINNKYGIKPTISNILEDNPKSTTKLSSLNTESGDLEMIAFLDESKLNHNCYISMIDFNAKKNVNLLRYHCYWDRCSFSTKPIGCPINYIYPKCSKTYKSFISKCIYTINESITNKKTENIKQKINKDNNIELIDGNYYETDGVFCSFNCCKAYIMDNKHNPLYNNSELLLNKLYNEVMGSKKKTISQAPHWRNLEQYGGHLNIIQFRENFHNINYEYCGTVKKHPKFISICSLYEEKIKF